MFRSARHIYAQIVDDGKGQTLVAASTLSGELKDKLGGLKKTDAAKEVGKLLAAKAKDKGIRQGGLRPQRLSLSRPGQGRGG